MKLDVDFDNFIHPSTYVNKLLFSGEGGLQLWNIMTQEKIYDFKEVLGGDSPLTVSCVE
jgi:hypothetical protein